MGAVAAAAAVVMGAVDRRSDETVHGPQAQIRTSASSVAAVDVISSLLDGPRARRAFLLQVVMEPPFSIRVEDEAPLSLIAATHGTLLLVDGDTGLTVTLAPGDVALARGPSSSPLTAPSAPGRSGQGHYLIADAAETEVQVVIKPGQVCTLPDGVDVKVADILGTRTWGSAAEGHLDDRGHLRAGR